MLAARKQAYIEPEMDGAWVAEPVAQPRVRARAVARPNYAKRFMSVISTLIVAGAAFFLVMRFELVSQNYAVNNQLKEEIRAAQQHIGDLKVELEFAVDLQRVQRLARQMEMDYPDAGQLHEIQRPEVSEGDTP